MRSFVVKLVVTTLSLVATVRLVPGLEFDGSIWALVAIALVFGVVNAVIRPVVKILALPVIILTLGIGALFINGLLFWLVVWLAAPERLDLALTSDGFWPAFFGAIIMGIIAWALGRLLDRK
jgi:putative membrane protein